MDGECKNVDEDHGKLLLQKFTAVQQIENSAGLGIQQCLIIGHGTFHHKLQVPQENYLHVWGH